MKLVIFLLSIVFASGSWAQTVQEQINTRYNPWDLSAFSLLSTESDQISNGGQLNTYNFIGPNYRINQNERIAMKVAFNANTSGYSRFSGECLVEQDGALADPFVEYTQYNLGLLPGVADVFWNGRVFLPFSKNSRRQGLQGRYRSNTIFTRYVTQNIFLEYRNEFNFYHQSQATYRSNGLNSDCTVGDRTGLSNTRRFRLDNWISAWYVINRDLSFGVSAILRDEFYNESNGEVTSRQRNGRMHEIRAMLGPSIRYNFSYNASFILSFRDVVEYSGYHPNRQDDLVELGEFRSRNTELALLSFIRF